jgi:hypothetical protein
MSKAFSDYWKAPDVNHEFDTLFPYQLSLLFVPVAPTTMWILLFALRHWISLLIFSAHCSAIDVSSRFMRSEMKVKFMIKSFDGWCNWVGDCRMNYGRLNLLLILKIMMRIIIGLVATLTNVLEWSSNNECLHCAIGWLICSVTWTTTARNF